MTHGTDITRMLPAQKDLVSRLERLLIAPCCFTQTIDVHMSDVARDMCQEVAEMVLQGQNERQIIDHYKSLYGEKILAVPDGRLGAAAFAVPVITSSFATSGLLYFLYRFHKRKSALSVIASGGGPALAQTAEGKQILERIRKETAW